MGSVFRLIINLLIVVIVVCALYILGLMFHVVPLQYTPQVVFKDSYRNFKTSLKDSNSSFAKSVYGFLDTMDKSYQAEGHTKSAAVTTTESTNGADADTPATSTPMMPVPQVPAPAPAPQTPTTPSQDSVHQEKKVLDSL